MDHSENIFGRIQPQNEYPEIVQFFKMLTLPRAILGYDRERVIDALRCLDGLYRNKIVELEEENRRDRELRQSQLRQKDNAIAQLEKKVKKEEIVNRYGSGNRVADAYRQVDVISRVAADIQQSLDLVIRKAAAQARGICEDARRQADEIMEENRRQIEEEQRRHSQALERMSELKKQYLTDISALQAILQDMQAEARRFQQRLEDIGERAVVE